MSTWMITGCSTGIGRHLAQAVLAQGHNAVVTARDTAAIQDFATSFPDRVLALPFDVTRAAEIAAAVAAA